MLMVTRGDTGSLYVAEHLGSDDKAIADVTDVDTANDTGQNGHRQGCSSAQGYAAHPGDFNSCDPFPHQRRFPLLPHHPLLPCE